MNDIGRAGLVLAAGRGSRFTSEGGVCRPKVLQPILGRPMISYVLDALDKSGVRNIAIVIGHGGDEVRESVGEGFGYVTQKEQKGSGHAVAQAREFFADFAGSLVVMCGDSPMFRPATIEKMLTTHENSGAVVTLASAGLDDPRGYGRIIRACDGSVEAIVEEKCATCDEKLIREVNGGAYVFDAVWLFANIGLMAENDAGEYNLTDMVRVAIEQGRRVETVACDPTELAGVNTPEQLRATERILGYGIDEEDDSA